MQTRIKHAPGFYPEQTHRIIRFMTALAMGVVGAGYMLSMFIPRLAWDTMEGAWPWPIRFHIIGVHSLNVIVGFFLVMLSFGLMRGKFHAWRITLTLLLLSAFLHILHGGSIIATVIALGLSTLLTILHRYFQARSDPPSVRQGYVVLVLGLSIVVFYTIGGFVLLYNHFEGVIDHFGPVEFLLRLVTATPLHLPHDSQAFFFRRGLSMLCLSAVLYGMLKILRPVAKTLLANEQERQKVTELVRMYGKNSISYFALSEDKSYFFSRSGKSVISYVLEGNVAVVAGDPIGPDNEMLSVMKEFLAFCNVQDWTIAIWQVRDTLADLYCALGLHLLKIGEDAVINTSTFTLKGGAMANVRSSAKRAEKDGVRIIFNRGQIENGEQLFQMMLISQAWLAQKGNSEMGFSMGRFDPQGDTEQITAIAVDNTNRVHAFATFVPIYGRKGWGLDLMRRAEKCVPGCMELLLARSIEYFKSCGADVVSLGLAPMSNANTNDETFLDTSIDFMTSHFGNLSKSASLFNFKKKFQPTWESRYLVFSHTLTLPRLGWALFKAHQRDASILSTLRQSLVGWQKSVATQTGRRQGSPLQVSSMR